MNRKFETEVTSTSRMVEDDTRGAGDADTSYDFLEIPRFVEMLRQGYELVQGCRLPAGEGRVMPDAIPFLHRWWGNPMFSVLARCWFNAPIHDVYCGLRGFTKDLQQRLHQLCTGMEFETEMIIKSSLYGVKIAEVPITLHPDGRQSHAPHLKTFRDGWRTLRFSLMYCPRWMRPACMRTHASSPMSPPQPRPHHLHG